MYNKILLATELAETSREIAFKAIKLAGQLNATLYLVHVIEIPQGTLYAASIGFTEYLNPITDNAEMVLNALGDELNIPKSQQLIRVGSASHHILAVAEELAVELIIVGAHSKNGLLELVGSTAHNIAHHAKCDVLTIRPSAPVKPQQKSMK